MRIYVIISILLAVSLGYFSTATAQDQTIQNVCANKAAPDNTQTDIYKMIDKMLVDFKDQNQRVKNRVQFVSALDQIIANSKFAYLLKCRDDLNAMKDFSYELVFQDLKRGNDSMAINPVYSASRSTGLISTQIQLEFNLVKAANSVLFVYMHELKHVCQAVEAAKLYSNTFNIERTLSAQETNQYNALVKTQKIKTTGIFPTPKLQKLDDAIADENRFRYFGEVEAFYTMQLAYRSLVQVNKKLCGYETWQHPPDVANFYDIYVGTERGLSAGIFAQPIVFGYLPEDRSEDRFVLDLKSQQHNYTDPDSGENFVLRRLHPKLKNLISSRLPISIVEF